jgi:hypothetical protein
MVAGSATPISENAVRREISPDWVPSVICKSPSELFLPATPAIDGLTILMTLIWIKRIVKDAISDLGWCYKDADG